MKYQEKQIGWFSIIFIVLSIWLNIAFVYQLGDNPLKQLETNLLTILFGILFLLFYQMKTEIDDEKIKIMFGIGIIRKTVKLNTITHAECVRNKWYNGIGIRMLQNGWLYNIHGMDAIELNYRNSKNIIRIGTQKPAEMKDIINGLLK
ncbi:MAG: hypothetical protein WCK02_15955 [Bacteroidota bacterium]